MILLVKHGIDLAEIKQIKEVQCLHIKEYLKKHPDAVYTGNVAGEIPAVYTINVMFPCATQNDISIEAAKILVKNGIIAVGVGANMPTTLEAIKYFQKNGILLAPSKAANAGGVAISALEMSQNSMQCRWTFEEVDQKLDAIMTNIFANCKEMDELYNLVRNYLAGANITAFKKVAEAMMARGVF